ncbi:MAG: diguanylate cyclase [Alphaproteobacteria bacterium]
MASESVLGGFSGPALVVDAVGRVVGASPAAEPLAAALSDDPDRRLMMLIAAAIEGGPRNECITVSEDRTFEMTLLPLIGDAVLLVGRDATLDHNLRSALVDSRKRYKDIVECSSDFAWETGVDGTFEFVSPRGALGYGAAELVGRRPHELLHERQDPSAPLPFAATAAMEDVMVWFRAADGTATCLQTSCLPRFDRNDEWAGARGVCRDVTEARARDEALARARRRERLVAGLVNTIREEVDPEKLLARAAEATGRALDATFCWIYRVDDDVAFVRAAAFGGRHDDTPAAFLVGELAGLAQRRGVVDIACEGYRVIAAAARHRRGVNGAICVARYETDKPWNADDGALLGAVGEHLGIAIEQIASHETLKRLSRTDALTGLLNRRAFGDELLNRYDIARRTGRSAAVLYLDLDNFKLVNDVHGHRQGDAVLRGWAEVLRTYTRSSDVIARLGGDEFAIWLEDTGENGAVAKAESLIGAGGGLAPYSGDPEKPLRVSVGVAVFDPGTSETLDDVIARADAAMYRAKKSGKDAYALAPSIETRDAKKEKEGKR